MTGVVVVGETKVVAAAWLQALAAGAAANVVMVAGAAQSCLTFATSLTAVSL